MWSNSRHSTRTVWVASRVCSQGDQEMQLWMHTLLCLRGVRALSRLHVIKW
jgi:hypothetical protein